MEEINLLQNRVKDTTFAWQRQANLVIAVLAILLILLAGGGVSFMILNRNTQSQIGSISAENQSLQQQFDQKQSGLGDAKIFQAQLANIKTLVNSHRYISPVLDEVARVTYVKAEYLSFEVSPAGHVSVIGSVSSYNDMAKLLLGLSTSDMLKNIKLLTLAPSPGKVAAYQFGLVFDVDPQLFTKK